MSLTKHNSSIAMLFVALIPFTAMANDFSKKLIEHWKTSTTLIMEEAVPGSSTLLFPPVFLSGSPNKDSIQISSNSDDAKEDIGGSNLGSRTTGGDLVIGEGYSGSSTSPTITGVRFRNVNIPAGATVTEAYIKFTARTSESGTCNLQVWGELTDDAVSYSSSNPAMSTRTKTTETVNWDNVENWTDLNVYETPDLSAILQEIVDQSGWASGNDVSFLMEGDDRREAYSRNNDPNLAPELVFDYNMVEICGNGLDDDGDGLIDDADDDCFSPPSTAVTSRVNANSDDAEEDLATGSVSTGSTDLEMIWDDPETQAVGLRFKNITVPAGARIVNAYIEFTADESQNTATSVTFTGHADIDPKNFADNTYKINDRPKTSATVDWNSIDPWTTGYRYRSPNLASIVQEIVNLNRWLHRPLKGRPHCIVQFQRR